MSAGVRPHAVPQRAARVSPRGDDPHDGLARSPGGI